MYKTFFVALILLCALAGCKPSTQKQQASASVPATNDAVDQKLLELAGNGATNCGRLKSQATTDLTPVSKCATDAAQQKHAFYAAYDMPGMTVGVAGNSEGKLFSVQSQTGGAGVASEACPAELRVAPSGRLTCYAPGTFPMGAGAGSHSSMPMPPAMGPNPHQGAGAQSNPHQSQSEKPSSKL